MKFKGLVLTMVLLGILLIALVTSSDVLATPTDSFLSGRNLSGTPSAMSPSSTGTWHALGDGVNNTVRAVAVVGSDVYVGGEFFNAGGNPNADYIARWDGSSWQALGNGLGGAVQAIAVSGSDIYVGGNFANAGGDPDADKIARWDGSSWHALGGGLDQYTDTVYAIAVSGSDVYVGGALHHAGESLIVNNIARWDGSAWHALGNGLIHDMGASQVEAIAVSGSDVYAGGHFTNAGGDPNADYIARWDGSAWHSLGSGIVTYPDSVRAITVAGTDVYIGGTFMDAGGNPDADYIARWDGSSWHGLGFGISSSVYAIEADGSDIYAGYSSGGSDTKGIARYDGTAWRALGSGLTNTPSVWAIAANDTDVYVGGSFTQTYVTGMIVNHIARWEKGSEPKESSIYLPCILKQ